MEKKQVLWADDDMDDLMLMRHVLKDIGEEFDIKEVHNGREALDYLEVVKQKGPAMPDYIRHEYACAEWQGNPKPY
jgi:CheY-like chemotaxis protein